MGHHNTAFSQLLKLIPRHEFETLAKQHHCGRSFRKASRWSQFVTLSLAQLTGRSRCINHRLVFVGLSVGEL
ncbi:MAG: DUF4372 domain-containing protein [Candidatus Azotimanducaceae bacterium WSBS_2022_MAG_OTU7]